MKAKAFTVLFGLAFAAFGWAILFYSDWFIPVPAVSWSAAVVAAALAVWFVRTAPGATLERRALVKLAVGAISALFLWGFLAQTIPALVTRFIGSIHEETAHASYHYRSTRTCRSRLILREFNPPFGGFCRVGMGGFRFKKGDLVRVTYRESPLGRFVLRFDRAR